jgi:hypothetical protein
MITTTDGKAGTRWEKQAPAPDPHDIVNYSGSIAAGLRFETSDGRMVAIDSRTIRDLFAALRSYNPLWDGSDAPGGMRSSDHLRNEFTRLVAGPWSLADPATEAQRFHRVLEAEGHELPRIEPVRALQPFVGNEVLFFDRGNICLATLSALQPADLPEIEAALELSPKPRLQFQFDVTPIPEATWEHSSPFYVLTDPESVVLRRGCFYVSMTNIWIITAPELITRCREILRQHDELRTLIPALRRCLSRH